MEVRCSDEAQENYGTLGLRRNPILVEAAAGAIQVPTSRGRIPENANPFCHLESYAAVRKLGLGSAGITVVVITAGRQQPQQPAPLNENDDNDELKKLFPNA